MELQIIMQENQSKYMSIYESIKQSILCKKVNGHEALPPKRKLAEQLNVSVYTVQQAYEQLLTEGYVYSIEKQGIYVSDLQVDVIAEDVQPFMALSEEKKVEINFKNGQVDANLFPFKVWGKLMQKHFTESNASNSHWQGEPALRNEIAHYLRKARGLSCQPSQIFIGSGVQHQLQMLMQFLQPSKIGIENPGFHRALHVFQRQQADIHFIVIDEEGCEIPKEKLDALYITPAHQFPIGTIMSIARKMQLIEWAKQADCYLIEDDYDAEFRYVGTPIPPISQITQKQSIYVGSFSKTLLPAFRISYMVIPMELVDAFENSYALQKSTVCRFTQSTLAEFMKEGYYERHIAKMRTHYAKKRNAVLQQIQEHFGSKVTVKGQEAGLHLLIQFPYAINESKIIQKAKQRGLVLDVFQAFEQTHNANNILLIGYGAPSMEELSKGLRMLKEILLEETNETLINNQSS